MSAWHVVYCEQACMQFLGVVICEENVSMVLVDALSTCSVCAWFFYMNLYPVWCIEYTHIVL